MAVRTIKILIFSLIFSNFCAAQIVNIETKRKHKTDTLGVFGFVDLGFNLVQNGNTILTTKNNAQLEFIKNRNRLLFISNFNLIRVAKANFLNNGFQHLRFSHFFNDKIAAEIFTQYQYNQQVRIKLRALGGAGFRSKIFEKNETNAYLGLAYMFEYNEIKDTTIIHRENRLSSYFSFELKPNANFKILGTTYFQPRFPSFSKIRISTTTSLQLKITKKLSFGLNFQLTHDGRLSEDAPSVPETIYSFSNSLRWDF